MFSSYDDEGYVMMSLSQLLQGQPLYDETYTQYGPAFFLTHAGIHQLFDIPISHDIFRMKMIVQWLMICLLSSFCVFRLTRSFALSLIGFVSVFCLLERFCFEPGHPQEFAALGVAVVAALATLVREENRNHFVFALFAVVAALLVLTKINIGAMLVFGLAISMVCSSKRSPFTKLLGGGLIVAGCLLPVSILTKHFSVEGAVYLPLMVIGSLTLVIGTRSRSESPESCTSSNLILFATVFVAVVFGTLGIAWMAGTSPSGLTHGIILQHLQFSGLFFAAPPVSALVVPAAIVVTFAAVLVVRGRAFWIISALRFAAFLIIASAAIFALTETLSPNLEALESRLSVAILMSFTPLICWVILFPDTSLMGQGEPTGKTAQLFARRTICLVAIFQLLVCYPIPGSQVATGTFLLVIVCLIAVSDFLRNDLEHVVAVVQLKTKYRVVVGSLVVIVVATLLAKDFLNWQRRSDCVPLQLYGATKLRLPKEQARRYQELAAQLRENDGTFLFRENTENSFYFWTQKKPPTAINATVWPFMLNEDEQQRTVDAIENRDNVLLISRQFNFPLPAEAPLVKFLDEEFEVSSDLGHYRILKRIRSIPTSDHQER